MRHEKQNSTSSPAEPCLAILYPKNRSEAALRRIRPQGCRLHRTLLPLRQILSIAAAAALLLAAGYFLSQPPAHEALFYQQFDYLPSAVNIEGGDKTCLPSRHPTRRWWIPRQTILVYEAGNYQQAELMEKHLATSGYGDPFVPGYRLAPEKNTRNRRSGIWRRGPPGTAPQPSTAERPAKWYLGSLPPKQ